MVKKSTPKFSFCNILSLSAKKLMGGKQSHACLSLYVALLFSWTIAYGIVYGINTADVGLVKGIVGEVSYLFTDSHGFMDMLVYLSPMLAWHLGGKRSAYFYYLPLVWTALDTALAMNDMHPFVTFWVMAVVSFYASIKIASYAKN